MQAGSSADRNRPGPGERHVEAVCGVPNEDFPARVCEVGLRLLDGELCAWVVLSRRKDIVLVPLPYARDDAAPELARRLAEQYAFAPEQAARVTATLFARLLAGPPAPPRAREGEAELD